MNDVIQSQNEKGRGCATSIVVAFLIIGLIFLSISFVALGIGRRLKKKL